jgi:hypothetical protein
MTNYREIEKIYGVSANQPNQNIPGGSSTQTGLNYVGALRLGYIF